MILFLHRRYVFGRYQMVIVKMNCVVMTMSLNGICWAPDSAGSYISEAVSNGSTEVLFM